MATKVAGLTSGASRNVFHSTKCRGAVRRALYDEAIRLFISCAHI
jgi:hypothetical protein